MTAVPVPPAPAGGERKVLVGRIYPTMNTSWSEQAGKSFDEVVATVAERAEDGKVNQSPDEILEVIVVRRARVSGRIEITEDSAAAS